MPWGLSVFSSNFSWHPSQWIFEQVTHNFNVIVQILTCPKHNFNCPRWVHGGFVEGCLCDVIVMRLSGELLYLPHQGQWWAIVSPTPGAVVSYCIDHNRISIELLYLTQQDHWWAIVYQHQNQWWTIVSTNNRFSGELQYIPHKDQWWAMIYLTQHNQTTRSGFPQKKNKKKVPWFFHDSSRPKSKFPDKN